jgi:putative endonuclease
MPSPTQKSGQEWESRALEHLQAHGLEEVARNFRCKAGEIDLICRDGQTLVFVEVRRRASGAFGGAAASVGWSKQAKLIRAAQFYLLRYRAGPPPCRFDVVAVEGAAVEWIRDAFAA